MRSIKFGAVVAVLSVLLSGCGTVRYNSDMNMSPIQWVKYLAEKHSGWPTSFVVVDNPEQQSIAGTIRSYRGSLSFKNSMDDYCLVNGGKNYESGGGQYSCYNPAGATYYYTLSARNIAQNPAFSVQLISLVRNNDRVAWEFFKAAKLSGAVFPPESNREFGSAERHTILDAQDHEDTVKAQRILEAARLAQLRSESAEFKVIGAQVCQDLKGNIRLLGTVEQVEGDRIKVFVERAFYVNAPGLVPGGFSQGYYWLNSWDVKSCR